MKTLALISGSWPPNPCGVGDYTHQLANALADKQITVRRVLVNSLTRASMFSDEISASEVLHIQYPTMGYGRSLAPALIPVLNRNKAKIVTIHEFSVFKTIRRPWFFTFAHAVDARIFTSQQEMEFFKRVMRPSRGADYIVPLASNIGRGSGPKQPGTVCSFGLLTPNKGIEDFLELAEIARDVPELKFVLVGARAEMYRAYADTIIEKCKKANIEIHLDQAEDAVANILQSQEFAYLPFPDGATLKRGSLLAAYINDAIILTRHSESTPDELRNTTLGVSSPSEAKALLLELLGKGQKLKAATESMKSFAIPDWSDVAARHIEIYERHAKT